MDNMDYIPSLPPLEGSGGSWLGVDPCQVLKKRVARLELLVERGHSMNRERYMQLLDELRQKQIRRVARRTWLEEGIRVASDPLALEWQMLEAQVQALYEEARTEDGH